MARARLWSSQNRGLSPPFLFHSFDFCSPSTTPLYDPLPFPPSQPDEFRGAPMERRRPLAEPKRSGKEKARKNAAAVDDDGEEEEEEEEEDRKRQPLPPPSSAARRGSGGGGTSQPCCQAEKCTADLMEAKRYHRRHKVCEAHSKAPVVIVAGLR